MWNNRRRIGNLRHEMDYKLFVSIGILLFTTRIVLIGGQSCPALMCKCKWTNGKETAFCDNKTLDDIPIGIPVSTQVLDLSLNHLRRLGAQVFRERRLINLQKLFMSKCKLGYISDDSFLQLTNLIEIDLCDNSLEYIPTVSLQKCKSLRRLSLCLNPIRTIGTESFTNLNSLVSIDLSSCQIDSVESHAFSGLNQLRYLKLDSNRLTTLAANSLTDLRVLHSIDLHQNRWHCDCKLEPSVQWLLNNSVPQTVWPTCHSPPRLEGHSWNSLNSQEFSCSPEFHTQLTRLQSRIGQNITIGCIVSGFPLPSISWKFGFEFRPEDNNMFRDNDKRYAIDTQVVNETFVSSYITINGVKPEDGRQFICLAANKGGANHQNFSLSVRQGSDDMESDSDPDSNGFRIILYIIAMITALVIGIVLLIVSLIRSKKCSRIRTTKLSPNLGPIDILQNVKTSDLEMKNMFTNKPEIALISDIIRDTNDLKPYRFGADALTPDVTKFGPHYSRSPQQSSIAMSTPSTTLSTSVSFETFRSTPPLLVLDSTERNLVYNNRSNNVNFHQFSADNRFQYKKLNSNSFNVMNKSVANGVNECQKLLVLSANRTAVNVDMPSTTTDQDSTLTAYTESEEQLLKPKLLQPVLTHSVSHSFELDKELLVSDLDAQNRNNRLNTNNTSISVTQV